MARGWLHVVGLLSENFISKKLIENQLSVFNSKPRGAVNTQIHQMQ
jgi:hypothetical protein